MARALNGPMRGGKGRWYTNILIPTDGSELSEKAVSHGIGLVLAAGIHVHYWAWCRISCQRLDFNSSLAKVRSPKLEYPAATPGHHTSNGDQCKSGVLNVAESVTMRLLHRLFSLSVSFSFSAQGAKRPRELQVGRKPQWHGVKHIQPLSTDFGCVSIGSGTNERDHGAHGGLAV
jgi:hypothetical protein